MEIWLPYGEVETLLTVQAENLAELIEPRPEDRLGDLVAKILESYERAGGLFVCDSRRATIRTVKELISRSPLREGQRVLSPVAKSVEALVPELKGRVTRVSLGGERLTREGAEAEGPELTAPAELLDQSAKLFLATGAPDPLFGFVDARVSACLQSIGNARRLAYEKRQGDAPKPLEETSSYDSMLRLSSQIPNAAFFTVLPRGGEPFSVLEECSPSRARSELLFAAVSQAKAMVVSPGGRGYDDTLSNAVRCVWSVIEGVRRNGEIVLVSECRDGIGSQALQMFTTGRLDEEAADRKGTYFEGMEEVQYVKKLKEDYSVTLLSTLPELYSGSRLRFRSARGSGDALNRLFGAAGRGAKMHVVTRAGETVLSRA